MMGLLLIKISEILIIVFNPSCDGISSLETLNRVIGYEVA